MLDRWETADGLPENSATAIVQGKDGYLWFGTFNGLVRFDGMRCVVFDPSNTPELPSAAVVNLLLDQSGGLWVSTSAGLARLHQGQWSRLTTNGWNGNYVRSFAERENGEILLTTFDGHLLEFRNGKFNELPKPGGDSREGYLGFVDEKGDWWAVQNQFVGSWNGTNWVKRLEIIETNSERVGAGAARDGGLWILNRSELFKLKGGVETERRKLAELPGGFWHLYEDRNQNVWISTFDKGLVRAAPDGSIKRWTTANGLVESNARMVMEDDEENIWFGTSGSGLARLKAKRFHVFGTANGLWTENVKSIAQGKDGEMLLATYGKGLFSLDQKGIKKVRTPWDIPGWTSQNTYLQSLLTDHQGRIWVGGFELGLCRLDDGLSEVFPHRQTGANIWSLVQDSARRIWAGGEDRVMCIDDGGVRVFDEQHGLRGRKFLCWADGGQIWTASSEGVFRLAGERFEEVGQSIRDVTCLMSDGDGGMWMGTGSAGLAHWGKAGLKRIGAAEKLPVRTIVGMIEDDLGFYWLASNRGIVRVAKSELMGLAQGRTRDANFITLGIGDGLPTLECSGGQQPNCARDTEGRLWFATLRGAAMIDPRSFRINAQPPRVYVEEISYTDRQSVRRRGFPKPGEKVVIPPGSTRFETKVTGLSFRAPEDVTYTYTLRKQGRVLLSDSQKASVLLRDRLPYGEYTLHVGARNADGVATAKDVVIDFVVQAFFWETTWFRAGGILAAILAVGGGTWGWTRFRWRRELENLRHQQALAELQARLAAVMENTTDMVGFASAEGKVMFVNAAGRRMLKIPDGEVVEGKSIAQFHPGNKLNPVTARALRAAQEKGSWSGENMFMARDGTLFPVSQVLMAHRKTDGRIEFFSTVARDISERIRSERALRESEERYRTLIENLPVGIVVAIDEVIVFANATILSMRARTREEVVGRSVYEIIPPEYHEKSRERRKKILETGTPNQPMELVVRRKDGTVRYVESQAVRLNYDGKPAIINFVQDLTDRKIAEKQREEIGQELRELAGQMMRLQDEERRRIGRELHDSTGQTLAALEINLGMLARRLASSGGKEAQLIEECMKLAGQCSGEIRTTSYLLHPPLLDEVGLSSALRWYVDGFMKRSNIEVNLTLPESTRRFTPEIELSLFRVVQESLTNIHRHSGSKTARIEFLVKDSELILAIADEGSGIEREKLRLFREGHSNLGVGITGMRERIRQLNGELTVESDGRGTVVRARLSVPPVEAKT